MNKCINEKLRDLDQHDEWQPHPQGESSAQRREEVVGRRVDSDLQDVDPPGASKVDVDLGHVHLDFVRHGFVEIGVGIIVQLVIGDCLENATVVPPTEVESAWCLLLDYEYKVWYN